MNVSSSLGSISSSTATWNSGYRISKAGNSLLNMKALEHSASLFGG